MKWTVDGNTQIGWSCLVEAETEEEAIEKAKEYWNFNTTYEDVQVDGAYQGE